jgi:hypothetical protein
MTPGADRWNGICGHIRGGHRRAGSLHPARGAHAPGGPLTQCTCLLEEVRDLQDVIGDLQIRLLARLKHGVAADVVRAM